MKTFTHINIENAKIKLNEGAKLVDIRDISHFNAVHHQSALHLTNQSINEFLQETDFSTPILVVCYHGNSSQNVASYLVEQGFESVYSVDGGMTAWAHYYPEDCTSN